MVSIITAISTGIAAFVATNIDDILILTLLFAQVNHSFRKQHIVLGQYLGFILLLILSLPGFFSNLFFPTSTLRLLGLIPLAIGITALFKQDEDDEDDSLSIETKENQGFLSNWLSPKTCTVAAITVTNGSDNIGVYVPLFANSNLPSFLVIITVFLTLVGLWCYAAYKFTNFPLIAELIKGYGNNFLPCILIGLGVFIVKESVLLTLIALAASYLWLMIFGNTKRTSSEVKR